MDSPIVKIVIVAFALSMAVLLGVAVGGGFSDTVEDIDDGEIFYQYIDSHDACQAVKGRSSKAGADATYSAVNATGSDFKSCFPPT